jgi:hypothetical protein
MWQRAYEMWQSYGRDSDSDQLLRKNKPMWMKILKKIMS